MKCAVKPCVSMRFTRVQLNVVLLGAIGVLAGSLWLRRASELAEPLAEDHDTKSHEVRQALHFRTPQLALRRMAVRPVATDYLCYDRYCEVPCRPAVRMVDESDVLVVSIASRHLDTNIVKVALERSMLRVMLANQGGEEFDSSMMLPFVADDTTRPEVGFATDQLLIRIAKPAR